MYQTEVKKKKKWCAWLCVCRVHRFRSCVQGALFGVWVLQCDLPFFCCDLGHLASRILSRILGFLVLRSSQLFLFYSTKHTLCGDCTNFSPLHYTHPFMIFNFLLPESEIGVNFCWFIFIQCMLWKKHLFQRHFIIFFSSNYNQTCCLLVVIDGERTCMYIYVVGVGFFLGGMERPRKESVIMFYARRSLPASHVSIPPSLKYDM